jgi:hypothetical protein
VYTAAEFDILRATVTTPPIGMSVVELEPLGFGASTTVRVGIGALVTIARTNGTLDGSRYIAGVG